MIVVVQLDESPIENEILCENRFQTVGQFFYSYERVFRLKSFLHRPKLLLPCTDRRGQEERGRRVYQVSIFQQNNFASSSNPLLSASSSLTSSGFLNKFP